MSQARDQRCDVLQVAFKIRRHGGFGREAAEDTGGRERQTEEAAARTDDGCGHAESDAGKKLLKPGSRRKAVNWAMKEKGYNQRWACALVGIDPRVYPRKPRRPLDTELRARLRKLSTERRRFGYRRLHILLKREGWHMNWKKLYRIYREKGLSVRKRGRRKRAVGTRTPMAIPQGANQRWSLDFMSDALADGRRLRILNLIDDFSRECLAAVVDTSLSGERVARELDRIAKTRGYPCMVVSDNGTELTSNAILKWQEDRSRVTLHRSRQADAEWFCGKIQWPNARRMPQRAPVRYPAPCPPSDCGMARRLQPAPPPFEPGQIDAMGMC